MKLFCDCKTDEEKSNFFLSGKAVETGVIAPAISNEVAMAYHRCAQFKKENDTLRAKISEMERQEPVAWMSSRNGFICKENKNPDYNVPLKRFDLGAQPAPSVPEWQSQAVIDVVTERRRQIEKEGWVPEHDDEHDNGELALAAAAYAISSTERNSSLSMASKVFSLTGWDNPWWKPHAPRPDLVRAGALILAEIERLDRVTAPKPEAKP